MTIDGPNDITIRTATLDPVEIRYCLLFWDKIAWPSGNVVHTPTPDDLSFLVNVGALIRPDVKMRLSGGLGELFIGSQLKAYDELERAEPGCWAMAQGERTLQVFGQDVPACRELLVTLTQAVPIPDGNVPFEEILEFKARRESELVVFRTEIEGLYQSVASSADPPLALRKARDRIESSCNDLIKVNKEWKFRSLLSDLNFSFSLTAENIAAGVTAVFTSSKFGLDGLSSMLVGAASTLSSSVSVAKNLSVGKATPYRYVARAHSELKF